MAVALIGSALGAGLVEFGGWFFQQAYLEQRDARAEFRRRAESFQTRFAEKAGAYLYASDRLIKAHSNHFSGPDALEALRTYNDGDVAWGRAEETLLSELQRVFGTGEVSEAYGTTISAFLTLDEAVDSLEAFPMSETSLEHTNRMQQARDHLLQARGAIDSLNMMILRAASAGSYPASNERPNQRMDLSGAAVGLWSGWHVRTSPPTVP